MQEGGEIHIVDDDTLECGDTFEFGLVSAVSIQTPNYPGNYPNGRQGLCRWYFDVPLGAKLSLFCKTFDVHKGDRFCIKDYNNYQNRCWYGTSNEPTQFPFTFYPSNSENFIYMWFRPNRRRNAEGIRLIPRNLMI